LIFQPCCYDWRCHCGFHPAPLASQKGHPHQDFMIFYAWVDICWLFVDMVGYILVWFDYLFDIFWYGMCDFQTWHTREIFTSVPCLEITYTISKYIKQMGMTSSTNAILDSKNTHFCVIHCPVFIHGHWYLLKKSKIAGKWMCNPQRQVNV
jgi:hypothetical protein